MSKQSLKHILKRLIGSRQYAALLTAKGEWRRLGREAGIQQRNETVLRSLLTRGTPIKLDLGAGENRGLEGWTTVDANRECDLCLNLANPLPFPDGSVNCIYSSHLLEHMQYPHPLRDLLVDCRRVLEPGGVISIAVPNARLFLDAYAGTVDLPKEVFFGYDAGLSYKARIDVVNYIAYMGGHHRHMFDEESLVIALSEVGFRDVRLREFDETIDLPSRRHESIYAVGRR